jgi:hypothetical protein
LLVISFLLVCTSRFIASRSVFNVRPQRTPRRARLSHGASARSVVQ